MAEDTTIETEALKKAITNGLIDSQDPANVTAPTTTPAPTEVAAEPTTTPVPTPVASV